MALLIAVMTAVRPAGEAAVTGSSTGCVTMWLEGEQRAHTHEVVEISVSLLSFREVLACLWAYQRQQGRKESDGGSWTSSGNKPDQIELLSTALVWSPS